jgi:hypothetical protein
MAVVAACVKGMKSMCSSCKCRYAKTLVVGEGGGGNGRETGHNRRRTKDKVFPKATDVL